MDDWLKTDYNGTWCGRSGGARSAGRHSNTKPRSPRVCGAGPAATAAVHKCRCFLCRKGLFTRTDQTEVPSYQREDFSPSPTAVTAINLFSSAELMQPKPLIKCRNQRLLRILAVPRRGGRPHARTGEGWARLSGKQQGFRLLPAVQFPGPDASFRSHLIQEQEAAVSLTGPAAMDTISCPFYRLSSSQRVSAWASCRTRACLPPPSSPSGSSASALSSS